MKRVISFLLIMLTVLAASAKKDEGLNYEIQGAGVGSQGTYLVKVTVITKDKKLPDADLKLAAVHGVLFRGFSGERGSQKALAGSPTNEAQHADFYKDFFKSGASAYAAIVPGSRQVVKSGKEYRVSCNVTVNKDQLYKDLVDAGVIKGLNAIF